MNKWLWTLCVSLIMASISPSKSAPASISVEDDDFELFLELAMNQFPNWLRSNSLDPISVATLDLTVDVPFVNITGNITDPQLFGHSNITEFAISQNFTARNFGIVVPMENYSINGLYNLEGLSFNTPIRGSGPFHFNQESPHGHPSYFMLGIIDFGISSDGYIDISVGEKTTGWFVNLEGRMDFSGLDAGENEAWLIYELKEKFDDQWNIWYPVPDLLYRYLDEYFKINPVTNFINATKTGLLTQASRKEMF